MASTTPLSALADDVSNPKPAKKGRARKALKNITANDANIPQSPADDAAAKDKPSPAVKAKAASKTKAAAAAAAAAKMSPADELLELQGMFEKLRLEKEKTDELLREKDDLLKLKEEEIEEKGREQEKLQKEVKKLQKIKEFKPTMTIPIVQSLREKEQSKKELQKKKNKDCPTIKKPSPAYVSFCKDHWNEIKKENTDASFKEISNTLGTKWKNLTPEEKRPYEEKYQEEKEAYLQVVGKEKREKEAMKLLEEDQMQKTAMELLEQYLHFKQEAEKETTKPTKKERDPLKPKQPMSAFFLYSNERRAALVADGKSVPEIGKITGEEWKNMSAKQRVPYEKIAKKQKEEYAHQMEVYKQNKAEEAECQQKEEEEQSKILKQEALQLLKKKEKTENIIKKTKEDQQKKKKQRDEKNSDPNKPKKPASSFLLFSKETRKALQEERPGIQNSTLSALVSVKWKEMGEEERKHWNDRAAEAMAAYQKEMEVYKKKTTESENSSQP